MSSSSTTDSDKYESTPVNPANLQTRHGARHWHWRSGTQAPLKLPTVSPAKALCHCLLIRLEVSLSLKGSQGTTGSSRRWAARLTKDTWSTIVADTPAACCAATHDGSLFGPP